MLLNRNTIESRYRRRKAARDAKRKAKLGVFDDFERVADFDSLYRAALGSVRGVAWKESIQRYEANALRNVAETRRKLLAGESVQSGFVEFTLRERGKTRRIKSVHISERVVQKCLCDNALVPILPNTLIHDNGASINSPTLKGAACCFLAVVRLRGLPPFAANQRQGRSLRATPPCLPPVALYRRNRTNEGYALLVDFKKFFDSIDLAVLFALLGRKIKDPRLCELTKNFITVFGNGKSFGLGNQVSQICAVFFPDRLDQYIKEKLRIRVIETNIHYPANNSLAYDRIKESGRLLEHLKEELNGLSYEEYKAKAKHICFKINVEKDAEKRVKLFKKRLKLFVQSINQVSNTVKKSLN